MFKIPDAIRTVLIYLPIGMALAQLQIHGDYWQFGALIVTALVLLFTRS